MIYQCSHNLDGKTKPYKTYQGIIKAPKTIKICQRAVQCPNYHRYGQKKPSNVRHHRGSCIYEHYSFVKIAERGKDDSDWYSATITLLRLTPAAQPGASMELLNPILVSLYVNRHIDCLKRKTQKQIYKVQSSPAHSSQQPRLARVSYFPQAPHTVQVLHHSTTCLTMSIPLYYDYPLLKSYIALYTQ